MPPVALNAPVALSVGRFISLADSDAVVLSVVSFGGASFAAAGTHNSSEPVAAAADWTELRERPRR